MIRMSLGGAIASILGRKDHEEYKDVGHKMKVSDLYKLLGLTGSPMLYSYMKGKVQTIEPERAKVILDKFGILIDFWLDEYELERDCVNEELSAQVAREPIRAIIEEIVVIESATEFDTMKRAIRKLIAKHY